MSQHADGTVLEIHYTGKLNDGTEFDSSREREPLQITVGQGMVIPGFEQAVQSMAVGENKTVTIPSDEAYGAYNPDMVVQIPSDNFPPEIPQEAGEHVVLRTPEGQEVPALIMEVTDGQVSLDANHPLAGQDLTFDLELMAVNPE
ncbi:MAG TPA: peptidylprolyl isomerase [Desulfomicrobiaceae bacterium]|nr:peptidylprolyl isomerase [Desulfomicrobiaceae bacterium]